MRVELVSIRDIELLIAQKMVVAFVETVQARQARFCPR